MCSFIHLLKSQVNVGRKHLLAMYSHLLREYSLLVCRCEVHGYALVGQANGVYLSANLLGLSCQRLVKSQVTTAVHCSTLVRPGVRDTLHSLQ